MTNLSFMLICIALSFFLSLINFEYFTDRKEKSFFQISFDTTLLYFLYIFIIPHLITYSRFMLQGFSIELLRQATRNIGPLMFFTLDYYISDYINIEYLQYLSIVPFIIIISYLSIGLINEIPFFDYTGFKWTYHALTHWSLAFVLGTLIFHSKTGNPITSLNFGFQSIMVAGWIYELPVCYTPAMFYHINYPTFIMPQIISLIILIWILHKHHFQPKKLFYLTLAIFLGFSLIYGLKIIEGFPKWFRKFIPRVPATAMLFSTTTGIQREKEENRKRH